MPKLVIIFGTGLHNTELMAKAIQEVRKFLKDIASTFSVPVQNRSSVLSHDRNSSPRISRSVSPLLHPAGVHISRTLCLIKQTNFSDLVTQSLNEVQTAKKLGVSAYEYFNDRVSKSFKMPSLAEYSKILED